MTFVADTYNHLIRVINATGFVSSHGFPDFDILEVLIIISRDRIHGTARDYHPTHALRFLMTSAVN